MTSVDEARERGPSKRKILAPHKEQDGWRYWRVRVAPPAQGAKRVRNWEIVSPTADGRWHALPMDDDLGLAYRDDIPGSRIISSRKVEQAVETWEYLERCVDEGLEVLLTSSACWRVYRFDSRPTAHGASLREAYHRFRAEARHE